jgi:hypothetical protein
MLISFFTGALDIWQFKYYFCYKWFSKQWPLQRDEKGTLFESGTVPAAVNPGPRLGPIIFDPQKPLSGIKSGREGEQRLG